MIFKGRAEPFPKWRVSYHGGLEGHEWEMVIAVWFTFVSFKDTIYNFWVIFILNFKKHNFQCNLFFFVVDICT